jgi:glycerol-3-phosphate dehydrogenase (NAD(P)+)
MMNEQKKIAVIGGGSWATAIVKMLTENLDTVGWYMRSKSAIEHIEKNNHNPKYLRCVRTSVRLV